jgi:curved DNA-binding protein CbpA
MVKKNKLKDEVSREGYDFYSILGFIDLPDKARENLTKKEITKNFAKKLSKYHPDRVPKDISKEERAEYNAMFNLIKKAGAVLTDPNRKKAYDMERGINKSSTEHWKKKDDFDSFIKAQQREATEENKQNAQLEFTKGLNEFKSKHGADKLPETALTVDESKELFDTRDTIREQEELEWMPTPMKFNNNKEFDHKTFMRAFEKDRMKKKTKGELLSYDDIGTFSPSNCESFNMHGNYGGLYNDEKFSGTTDFGGVSNSDSDNDNDDELKSIASDDINEDRFTLDKPLTKLSTDNILASRQSERDELDKLMKDRTINRFKSSIEDKFGPSHGLGFMVGTDKHGVQLSRTKYKDIDNTELKAYGELLGLPEKEVNLSGSESDNELVGLDK